MDASSQGEQRIDDSRHRHGWEDISERVSPYIVHRCNGLGGCGTIRRLRKILWAEAHADAAWEIMFEGERHGE